MRKFGWILVLAALGAASGCGGGGSSSFATLGSSSGTTSSSGASSGASSGGATTYRLGNGSGSGFTNGVIGVTPTTPLSAGGTASLSATIVDETGTLYTANSVTVTFNSPCLAQGLATITASGNSTAGTNPGTVVTTNGNATATYVAKGCSPSDVVTATATVGTTNLTATATITIAAATVGSIEFVSATPATIGLKGRRHHHLACYSHLRQRRHRADGGQFRHAAHLSACDRDHRLAVPEHAVQPADRHDRSAFVQRVLDRGRRGHLWERRQQAGLSERRGLQH